MDRARLPERTVRSSGGWVERTAHLPERLPGPAPLWWVALLVVMMVVPSLVIWSSGAQPFGEFDPRVWLPALIASYIVGFIGVLDGIARRAFDQFDIALGERADKDRLERALTSIPDRLAVPVIVILEIVVTLGYFIDEGVLDYLLSRPFAEAATIVVATWISIGLVGVLIVHTVVQLRMVANLHRAATALDLFDAGPAHAFARLTSATGIGFVVLGVIVLADPTARTDTVFFGVEAVAIIIFAAAAFGLPLRGIHDGLVAEKTRLLRATHDRIKTTTARIHDAVDTDDLQRTDRMNQSLASLIAERDLVSRLSTWPWSPSTFRGFASALLIPIVIWLITRILDRVV